MAIRFVCSQCGKKLKANEADAGAKVQCTGCGEVLVVPFPDAEAPGAQPPPSGVADTADVAGPEAPLKVGGRRPLDDEMDMTPMIDMTFLLLIFFMVTASFTLQKSIQMPMPDSTDAVSQNTIEDIEADDDFVVVRIDSDNTVWVNDVVAPSRQELLFKLREAREGGEGQGPGSLLVVASGEARHETVIMALDCGTAVGMEDVRLTTGEGEDY